MSSMLRMRTAELQAVQRMIEVAEEERERLESIATDMGWLDAVIANLRVRSAQFSGERERALAVIVQAIADSKRSIATANEETW
jgi:hypothetical protein